MLVQLTIRNLAIIREVQLEFSPHFTALTGETGAGKSIVIDALGLVLGGRASSDLIRSGASRAWVEAIFDPGSLARHSELQSLLEEHGVDCDEEQLILMREVQANGRSVARVNGRAVPATVLAAIGRHLVDIHGQSEHLSLLRADRQLELLDRYAGLLPLRAKVSQAVRAFRQAKHNFERLCAEERERAHRIDLFRYQLQEIARAQLRAGEDEVLLAERTRLLNAARLARLAEEVVATLDRSDQSPLDSLRWAVMRLEELERLDPSQRGLAEQLREVVYVVQDLVRTVQAYGEGIEADSGRLAAIEDRLDLLKRLKRKYGASIEEILAYAARAESELQRLESSEEQLEVLKAQVTELAGEVVRLAEELSAQRRSAARLLEQEMNQEMRALQLGQGVFQVLFEERERPEGLEERAVLCGETGWDRVDFLIALNPGQEPRSLGRIASGGEMARLMLALKSILSDVDEIPTLVFDEVDVGIGSRSAQVVGERLWQLAQRHQLIVISHLAQIAAFADRHFRIGKEVRGNETETSVQVLEGELRLEELAAMLDGLPVTRESLANARAMLERLERRKAELSNEKAREMAKR